MRQTHYISSEILSLEKVEEITINNYDLSLSEESKLNINRSRAYLDEQVAKSDRPHYGINTGFGSLCNVVIKDQNLSLLQENLVRSHACGTGDYCLLYTSPSPRDRG